MHLVKAVQIKHRVLNQHDVHGVSRGHRSQREEALLGFASQQQDFVKASIVIYKIGL